MTANQINYRRAKEEERANRAKETELNRSNVAREAETARSNRENEAIGRRNAASNERTANAKKRESVNKVVQDTLSYFFPSADALVGGATKVVGSAMNDPSWYNLDKQLVDDVARLPFGRPHGMLVPKVLGYYSGTPKSPVATGVLGAIGINLYPTIGKTSGSEADSINVAARSIYSYVRHANSGSANYEAPDLMMYLIAIDSLYIAIAEGMRLYSILRDYKAENRYYAAGLAMALGMTQQEFEIWLGYIPNLRALLNISILKANSLYVPNIMSYHKRHLWLATGIFKDAEIKKSTIYIPHFDMVYQNNPTEGTLSGIKLNLTDFNVYSSVLQTLLDNLIGIEDIGIISGDILKAYDASQLFYLSEIPDEFHIESVYSPEVLTQISGATLLNFSITGPTGVPYSTFAITQNTTGMIEQSVPSVSYSIQFVASGVTTFDDPNYNYPASGMYPLVNMYKDDVTPDDVMVATRLTATFETTVTGNAAGSVVTVNYGNILTAYGTELCGAATMVYTAYTPPTGQEISVETGYGQLQSTTAVGWNFISVSNAPSSSIGFSENSYLWCQADWAPRMQLIAAAAVESTGVQIRVISDSSDPQNYYYIQPRELEALHTVATLSEFGVPLLGMKVRSR